MRDDSEKDIAIIGMAVNFPMCNSLDEYWNVLVNGINCVSRFPKERQVQVDAYAHKLLSELEDVKYYDGAYLKTIDEFDNEFFKLSPRDASLMDPAHRIYMQNVVQAIEDAGYSMEALKGKKIGSFVGYTCCSVKDTYINHILAVNSSLVPYSITNNIAALIPSRISQLFDFRGPVMVLDTACSSSLVAVYEACRSIYDNASEMALACGIKLHLLPVDNYMFQLGIESEDGKTRTFDSLANGSGIGEGVCSVLLKPLSKAKEDGDQIYAVIKGSAINHDGTSIGLTAPNPAAQSNVIAQAWENANIDVEKLQYIEMHGTATNLGDPIEFQGLNKAFLRYTKKKQFCAVGTMKTNFGHLFEAAGIASLIKTALSMNKGIIPPMINLNRPNNKLNPINSAMYICTENTPWRGTLSERIAGISGFGLSGTNCHMVIQGYENEQMDQEKETMESKEEIFCFSASTPTQLVQYLEKYQQFIEKNAQKLTLEHLSYCINQKSGVYNCRICITAESILDLMRKIEISIHCLQEPNSDIENKPEFGSCISYSMEKARHGKMIQIQATNRNMEAKEAFLLGELIDWNSAYERKYQRISLPSYPFQKKHLWYEKKEEIQEAFYEKVWITDEGNKKVKDYKHILLYDKYDQIGNDVAKSIARYGIEVELVKEYQDVLNTLLEETSYDLLIYCIDVNQQTYSYNQIYHDIDDMFLLQKIILPERFIDIATIGSQTFYVTGKEKMLKAEHNMMYSFLRCLAKEKSNIAICSIDIEDRKDLDMAVDEILCGCGNNLKAIREGNLYCEKLQKKSLHNQTGEYILDREGVYVITGGAGGIGFEIAKSLFAMSSKIKLILLGRSGNSERELSQEQKQRINQLKEINQNTEYLSCNLVNEKEMERTFTYIYQKYGKITGIFHTAGIASGVGLDQLTRKRMHEVMDPKVKGTLLLDQNTVGKGLEFLILFSSIANVFPSYGLSDYTAASAFLDAYAQYYNKERSGWCMTINWATWAETGMSTKSDFTIDTLFRSLKSDHAIQLLHYALKKKQQNIIIGELNLDSPISLTMKRYSYQYSEEILDKLKRFERPNNPVQTTDKVQSTTNPDTTMSGSLYAIIEKQLIKICYELLGYENIDINANFFELGADSITLGHMVNKIEVIYPGKLKITDLLTKPNIRMTAMYLEEKVREDEELLNKILKENSQECILLQDDINVQNQITGKDEVSYAITRESDSEARIIVKDDSQSSKDDVKQNKDGDDVESNSVAVIGIGLHFPCARNVKEYWNILENGIDVVQNISESRKSLANVSNGQSKFGQDWKYRQASYIEDMERFDYSLFGISPRDASKMDPASRLFLQCCWTALEDAGYGSDALNDSDTGVFMGYSANLANLYGRVLYENDVEKFGESLAINQISMMPSRISYIKNLHGPSMVIDSACSSSLVSVENAYENIIHGNCKVALAGGAYLMLMPYDNGLGVGYESPDDRTRAFAKDSNGAATGEGVAVVVLKRLEDAIKDKDSIYAIIRGGAVNQDGSSNGIAAPNQKAQTEVIQKAWESAKIDPCKLSYIETHGTGTYLGDTIEIAGINEAFSKYTNKKQFCAFGSVKTNLGHLNEASGMTGLIKLILMMQHHTIVPTIHNSYPNTAINWMDSSVYLADKKQPWLSNDPLLAGISGFGMSGTNCHLVLEEARIPKPEPVVQQQYVFLFSAKSRESMKELLQRWYHYLCTSKDSLAGISYTLCCGRQHLDYRAGFLASSKEQVIEKISQLLHHYDNENDTDTISDHGDLYYGYYHMVPEYKKQRQIGDITVTQKLEGDELVKSRLKAKDLPEKELLKFLLCSYIKGMDIPWKQLFTKNEGFLHLPTYPFAKHRVWVSETTKEPSFYHAKRWVPKPRQDYSTVNGTIMLLCWDNIELDTIRKQFPADLTIIEVRIRQEQEVSCIQKSDYQYEITATQEAFHQLFEAVKELHVMKVIYLPLDLAKTVDDTAIDIAYEQCFYAPIHMVKGITSAHMDWELEFTIVVQQDSDMTKNQSKSIPQYAMAVGVARVMEQEFPKLHMSILNLSDPIDSVAAKELCCKQEKDFLVSLCHGERYVEEITVQTYEENTQYTFKQDGVYLVVGGTSGIGLEIARHLSECGCNNIILMARKNPLLYTDSMMDEELKTRIDKLQNLSETTKHLSIKECDVTNYDMVHNSIEEIRKDYGNITGIFYCAGLTNAGFILRKSEDQFLPVLDVKIKGSWNIDVCTKDEPLEFMMLCSSSMCYIGEAGQSDYVAANSYLDSFCEYRNKLGRRTYCIDWVSWKETGMSVRHGINFDDITKVLTTKQGIEKLRIALAQEPGCVMIGQFNFAKEYMPLFINGRCRMSDEVLQEVGISRNRLLVDAAPTEKLVITPHKKENVKAATNTIINLKIRGKKEEDISAIEKEVAQIYSRYLGYSEIDLYDNFFEMGGDSIIIMKVFHDIDQLYPNMILSTDLFEFTTIESLAGYIESKLGTTTVTENPVKATTNEVGVYPLSYAQRRIYFESVKLKGKKNYNNPFAFSTSGSLTIQQLKEFVEILVDRHEELRSTFGMVDGHIRQTIHESMPIEIREVSVKQEKKLDFQAIMEPFDLKNGPLLHVYYIKAGRKTVVLFDVHHIILDGYSSSILVKELSSLMLGLNLQELKYRYTDYLADEEAYCKSSRYQQDKQYWENELRTLTYKTIIDEKIHEAKVDKNYKGIYLPIEIKLEQSLLQYSKKSGITLFTVFLGSLYLALHELTGMNELSIGVAVLGRTSAKLQDVIGNFVNVLPIYLNMNEEEKKESFLKKLFQKLQEVYKHQDFPYNEIATSGSKNYGLNKLFDVMFEYENDSMSLLNEKQKEQSQKYASYCIPQSGSRADIDIKINKHNGELILCLNYNSKQYSKGFIHELQEKYMNLLSAFQENSDTMDE